MTRVVAVCGYSDGRETGLHPICERRLRLAEREAGPDDVVLLTGWARHADATAEAELMAQSWAGLVPLGRTSTAMPARRSETSPPPPRSPASSDAKEVLLGHVELACAPCRRAAPGGAGGIRPQRRGRDDRRACLARHPPARACLLAGCSVRRAQARLELEQRRREPAQRVEVELARRERLDADVIGARVEVGLHSLADRGPRRPRRRSRPAAARCRRPRGRPPRSRAGACCSGSSAQSCRRRRARGSARARFDSSSVRITACSGASSFPAPSRSLACAVCSTGTKYGCAPSVRSRARSSIFGPSAASTTGTRSGGSGPW